MTDWERVISYESLYKAHRRARLGKRHKKEVILFEANLSENLWNLHYRLKYHKYSIDGYHKFTIYDPKEREVQAISYEDRVVQHSLCDNYLTPIIDKYLIFDNVACRVSMGSSKAISRFREFMCKYYRKHKRDGYFVKIDVRKYFANISHELLKEKLKKILKDENCLELTYKIIDSYNQSTDIGLPIGNQSSQYFALLYLNDFDRYFKEVLKIKYYIRYMDDILMIVESKEMAQKCIELGERILNHERLIINPKSYYRPIKSGVEFLGWNFSFTPTGGIMQKLKKSAKKRILKKCKYVKYLVKVHKLSDERLMNSKVSYAGLLMRGNAYIFCKRLF